MITLPDPYPEALRSAFGFTVRVEVVGAESLPVPVIGGKVTSSADTAVSRSMSLDVAGEDFGIPVAVDLLAAILSQGGRLVAEAVLSVPGAADAVVPLGTFQVQTAKWKRSRRNGFTLDCLGLGSLLEDHRFDAPRTLASGSGLARLQALVAETLPTATVVLGTGITNRTVPEATVDEDRLGACRDLAVALGGRLYERADGVFEVRDLTGDTVDVDAVVLEQEEGYDRGRIYNGVRAVSSHEDYPAAVAWATDDDPASPTYWGGVFGKKPRFYASPLLTSVAEAQAAADTLLAVSLGRATSLALATVQDPSLEPGDVVQVTLDGTVRGFRVETLELPFQPGEGMRLTVSEVPL